MNLHDASAERAERLQDAIARRIVLATVDEGKYVYELLETGRVLTWERVRKAGGKFGAVYALGRAYDVDALFVRHVRARLEAQRDAKTSPPSGVE
jgi:hypothetical protein